MKFYIKKGGGGGRKWMEVSLTQEGRKLKGWKLKGANFDGSKVDNHFALVSKLCSHLNYTTHRVIVPSHCIYDTYNSFMSPYSRQHDLRVYHLHTSKLRIHITSDNIYVLYCEIQFGLWYKYIVNTFCFSLCCGGIYFRGDLILRMKFKFRNRMFTCRIVWGWGWGWGERGGGGVERGGGGVGLIILFDSVE